MMLLNLHLRYDTLIIIGVDMETEYRNQKLVRGFCNVGLVSSIVGLLGMFINLKMAGFVFLSFLFYLTAVYIASKGIKSPQ